MLVAAVMLAHAALLTGLPAGLGGQDARPAASLSVRQIVREAPPAMPAPQTEAVPPAAPSPRPPRPARRGPPAPPAAAPADAAPVPAGAAEPVPVAAVEPVAASADEPPVAPVEVAALPEAAASAPPAEAPPAAAALPGAPGEAPPTYATRMPPAAVLHYELRRGLLTGQGVLRWAPDGPNYDLQIDGTAFGLPVLSWISRGGFDAAGLAPQRFVDRRRGRDLRAANFQRERGVIGFSSVTAEIPLLPGAQDRLSWMVQLAAIVDADPARWQPGTQVEMAVTGSRGDSDVWTFTVSGREAVELAGGRPIEALALAREPRKPHDTSVQVWLDPARHHLPVRLRLSNGRDGDALLFVLVP